MRKNSMIKKIGLLAGLIFVVTSCGTANVNKVFFSKDESASANLERAQMAYDRGDFDLAEELATKAYDNSTNNGDAAVLLGSVMLSKSGIDVFQLVAKLAELSTPATTTTTTSTATDKCSSSTSTAAGSITRLSCLLLNLSTTDVANLGTDVTLTSDGLKSLGSYYKPNPVTDKLRESVSVLNYANKGIKFLCPFINKKTVFKDSIDDRHKDSVCGDKTGTNFNSAKAHVSFALLHLVEALVFQQGILIDASGSTGKVGINTISTSVNSKSFTTVSSFVSTMDEFKTVVDALADTTSSTSQIALAIDGLIVVANSFSEAGVPSSVTSTITGGLTKLKETASTLSKAAGSGSSTSNFQAQALKGQINEKYAGTMASKIDTVCGKKETSTCSETQKTQICASYSGISQGVDPAKLSKPDICK
ncbi:MAG: hypothetical protein NT027_08925 [Proteobacteria bacterium]|nr:hypothetical protein [Pseudomonadota bacterium]